MGPECVCANDPFIDEIKDVEEYLINEGYNIEELLRNAEELLRKMKLTVEGDRLSVIGDQ